jgi:predicted transposase YdaD
MTKKTTRRKPRRLFRGGTDEAFFQLMSVSGSGVLKLLGIPAAQASQYRFRAIALKDKKLQPDIEGLPILSSQNQRVIIEFQGYKDKFIRYRTVSEALWACSQDDYEGEVLVAIIFTETAYQRVALPLQLFPEAEHCRLRECCKEVVLTDYTEAQLLAIDPELVVLAPFTVAKDTDKAVLLQKGLSWQTQVKRVFPASKRPRALNIIGLIVLDRFSQLTYQEVKTMLHLDLSKSVAVQQMREMAINKGRAEGLAEGLAEGQAKGLAKGQVDSSQELILETLQERFGRLQKSLSSQIRQIQQYDLLKQLHRQALRCDTLTSFKRELATTTK